MRGRKTAILVLVLLIVVLLVSCMPFSPAGVGKKVEVEKVETERERVEVRWIEINPPPGVEGPCYAFFQKEWSGYTGHGYSGVICPNMK